jgi:hypothetical protein
VSNEETEGEVGTALLTSLGLHGATEELRRLEPIFHTATFGTTRRHFENMTDVEFWEIGASGQRYEREFVLDRLESRPPNPAEANWLKRDFECREIATDNFLVTYTLIQGARITRRATLWRRTEAGWKVLYHQGTLVELKP